MNRNIRDGRRRASENDQQQNKSKAVALERRQHVQTETKCILQVVPIDFLY